MVSEKDKIVTIRGINEEFYKQFQSFTRLMNMNIGSAFSELITHYKRPMPPILGSKKMQKSMVNSFSFNFETLEIIEGEEKLVLSKQMLIDVGNNTKFMFNNIKELILDESITDDLCIKYIFRIRNSSVKVKGEISKLLLYSVSRTNSAVPTGNNLKEVTIRNVNSSNYEHFVAISQLYNQSIGEAVNEIFSQYLPEAELMFIVINQLNSNIKDLLIITNIEKATIYEKELLSLRDRKVLFHRIKKLIFEDGITKETFQKYVIGIYNCKKVLIPSNIPKLLKLSRIKKFP